MLLDSNPKLEDAVVTVLGHCGRASAQVIQQELNKNHRRYSVQAIYQELRKLQRQEVVVKIQKDYQLRFQWVLEMLELTNTMYSRALGKATVQELLPATGQAHSWRFSSLHRLVEFYTELCLQLMHVSETKVCYEYAPHVWYHLAHTARESAFLSSMAKEGFQYYMIIRGDTFLDRLYTKLFSKVCGEILFGEAPFGHRQSDQYLCVADKYVSTISLSKKLRDTIEALYSGASSRSEIELERIQEIFHRKGSVRLKLENSPERANRLAARFNTVFNLQT